MRTLRMRPFASALLLAGAATFGLSCESAPPPSSGFPSPEAAMHELADTIGTHEQPRIERLFGQGGLELLESGDEVADREDGRRVQEFIRQKLSFEERGTDTRIALIGNEDWPFPIPLVRSGGTWHFDVQAGVEEISNRRVGRNELSTLATLHAIVDAQREYASQPRDGEAQSYARHILSTEGKHDGLYWPTDEGQEDSPLGPLIGAASNEGYALHPETPQPYHGYSYRMLFEQGAHAPGGAKKYLDEKGTLTGGFAMLAWPAKYGNSGVMTFLVNQQGLVYQRDLGDETDAEAARIQAFDPDDRWDPVQD